MLITDGASNSGKISPFEAAEHAKTLGIKIYTIAIGTKEGRVDRSIMRFPYQEFDLPTLQKIASTHRRRTLLGAGSRLAQENLHHHRPTRKNGCEKLSP